MEKVILIHGSGHKAASWNETVSRLDCRGDVLCPELSSLLMGKEASYPNLRAALGRTALKPAARSTCAASLWAAF